MYAGCVDVPQNWVNKYYRENGRFSVYVFLYIKSKLEMGTVNIIDKRPDLGMFPSSAYRAGQTYMCACPARHVEHDNFSKS